MNQVLIRISILCFMLFGAYTVHAFPKRILIIRHAEKPNDSHNPHLSPQGFERAQALTKLFNIHPEYARPTLPTAIFAAAYIPGKSSNRSIETVTPLANSLNLKVNTTFSSDNSDQLAQELLQNPAYSSLVIMIAWKHSMIPAMASALGAPCPRNWDDTVFDRIWIIENNGSQLTCADVPESVLPGDSN